MAVDACLGGACVGMPFSVNIPCYILVVFMTVLNTFDIFSKYFQNNYLVYKIKSINSENKKSREKNYYF